MIDPEHPGDPSTSVGSAPGDEPSGEVTLDVRDDDPQAVLREMMAGEAAGDPPAATASAAEVAEWREKYLRALADLENVRKRNQKTVADLRRYGHEQAVRELLPALDNLERALGAATAHGDPALEQFSAGVRMIAAQFLQTLERLNVVPVAAAGRPFDPREHEALQEQQTDAVPPGHVIAEVERGYRLHDRLLRPAKVIVARGPAAPAEPSAGS